jgi:phosphoribosylamine--glycine ligase
VLYAGLMVAADGTPYLLEHNVRFGDPETQVLMALLEGDLGELLASAAAGALAPDVVEVAEGRHAVVVVLAAAGYPASVRKGDPIRGLERAATVEGVQLLHAGTARREGEMVTAGGRVLGVTAIGSSTDEARQRAYAAIDHIRWEGMQYRRDIAASAG